MSEGPVVIGVLHDMAPQDPPAVLLFDEDRDLRGDRLVLRIASGEEGERIAGDERFDHLLIVLFVVGEIVHGDQWVGCFDGR